MCMEQKTERFGEHFKIFIISLVLFVIFILFLAGSSKPSTVLFEAENLTNTKNFSLVPYSYFKYNITLEGNYSDVVEFRTISAPSCLVLALDNSKSRMGTCIYPDGKDSSNSSYSLNDSFLFMYRPWMLALKPGFTWAPSTYLTVSNGRIPYDSEYYRVVRQEMWRGRPAFVVTIQRKEGTAVMYIDEEYRILLEEKEPRASIMLIQGPFPLKPQEE